VPRADGLLGHLAGADAGLGDEPAVIVVAVEELGREQFGDDAQRVGDLRAELVVGDEFEGDDADDLVAPAQRQREDRPAALGDDDPQIARGLWAPEGFSEFVWANANAPTSLAWSRDGTLFVTSLDGGIYMFTPPFPEWGGPQKKFAGTGTTAGGVGCRIWRSVRLPSALVRWCPMTSSVAPSLTPPI
jgi:hypothetical protein